MNQPLSKRHHFVPKLLLKPWLLENQQQQPVLRGYYWDQKSSSVRCKEKGMDAFCNQIDLLTLKAHQKGRDALEKVFFGGIDSQGAAVKELLLKHGPNILTATQRVEFARLLLSLEARRPAVVEKLRNGGKTFAEILNSDPLVLSEMKRLHIAGLPSTFFEGKSAQSLDDRAMSVIAKLVDNSKVGTVLINSNWAILRVGQFDGNFILSDRPLIRTHGYDSPNVAWVLPLEPKSVFVATNSIELVQKMRSLTGQRLVKTVNVSSIAQAERFIFSVGNVNSVWLSNNLPKL